MITVEQFWNMFEVYETNNFIKKKDSNYIFDSYIQMLNDNSIKTEITNDGLIIVDGSPKTLSTRKIISKLELKSYIDKMKNKKVVVMSVRFDKVVSIFDIIYHYSFYTRHCDLENVDSKVEIIEKSNVKPIDESLENHINDLL